MLVLVHRRLNLRQMFYLRTHHVCVAMAVVDTVNIGARVCVCDWGVFETACVVEEESGLLLLPVSKCS